MKKQTIITLTAIVAIVVVAMFAGCVDNSQDKEWATSLEKNIVLVSNSLEKMAEASVKNDYESLSFYAKYLYEDAQYALDESNAYSVSSKYEDTKSEYEKAMNDYKLAGEYTVTGIDKIQHGFVEEGNADMKLASEYIESGNKNFNKAMDLLKKA